MMKKILSPPVGFILEQLEARGFEAYLVGGSVRDAYLDRQPRDYDLATSARPDQVLEVFAGYRTLDLARAYGTIGLVLDQEVYEITSFRRDLAYGDGRRPQGVVFTSSLREDLARRDLTINALALDRQGRLIDYFGGLEDLDQGLVRTVGRPRDRLEEDHLRILRALRLAAQLDFTIEAQTSQALQDLAPLVQDLAVERVQGELSALLTSPGAGRGLALLARYGLWPYLVPELVPCLDFDQASPYHSRDLFSHLVCVVDRVPPRLSLRLAALFHDLAKPLCQSWDGQGRAHYYGHEDLGAGLAKEILQRMRYPARLIDQVARLVQEHMSADPHMGPKGVRRLIHRVGPDLVFDLIELMRADRACSRPGRDQGDLDRLQAQVEASLQAQVPLSTSQLALDGHDLLAVGFDQGPELGQALAFLTDLVLDRPELNDKDLLTKKALQWRAEKKNVP